MREAARLQSFEEDFRFITSAQEEGDTSTIGVGMDMIGEAVPSLLGEAFARRIASALGIRIDEETGWEIADSPPLRSKGASRGQRMTRDKYLKVAVKAAKALVKDRGENTTFPFDAVWSYAKEEVPGPNKPHQAGAACGGRVPGTDRRQHEGGIARPAPAARRGSTVPARSFVLNRSKPGRHPLPWRTHSKGWKRRWPARVSSSRRASLRTSISPCSSAHW